MWQIQGCLLRVFMRAQFWVCVALDLTPLPILQSLILLGDECVESCGDGGSRVVAMAAVVVAVAGRRARGAERRRGVSQGTGGALG